MEKSGLDRCELPGDAQRIVESDLCKHAAQRVTRCRRRSARTAEHTPPSEPHEFVPNDSRPAASLVESSKFGQVDLNWKQLQETFLTVAEIAELLKLNPQTIRNWIDRGSLPAVRVGPRRVRVRQADLDEFLKLGAKPLAEEQAPQAPPEEEPLGRKELANRLQRSVAWVDARVQDGMPNQPPSADNPHRRFRLAEVNAGLSNAPLPSRPGKATTPSGATWRSSPTRLRTRPAPPTPEIKRSWQTPSEWSRPPRSASRTRLSELPNLPS